jgi:sulfhydrogenase subunit beta (sulfur reductase)
MGALILNRNALPGWIELIRDEYRLIGPQRVNDGYIYEEIHSPATLELDHPLTILPPKKFLFPSQEELIRFNFGVDHREISPVFDDRPTVIFGVHTCDLHALELLDRTLGENYPDQHYLQRRKNTTIVSIECLKPCSEYSFCKSMGTLSVPETFDLHLTDLGTSYLIDVGSEKGSHLLRRLAGCQDASQRDYQDLRKVMSEKWSNFKYLLDFDVTELPSLLAMSYGSPVWDELGERCLSCGSCNIVCPTCYCFDVFDEINLSLDSGNRKRVWDSCQLDRFALVAGGHNFRSERSERLRHRFFHKGKYQSEATGLRGCVGCGRCAQVCLVHISPVEVFNELHRLHAPMVGTEQGAAI